MDAGKEGPDENLIKAITNMVDLMEEAKEFGHPSTLTSLWSAIVRIRKKMGANNDKKISIRAKIESAIGEILDEFMREIDNKEREILHWIAEKKS